jgi:hypothetical protein
VKKRMMIGAVALASVGLIAAFASSASALPTKTTDCSVCHSGTTLVVTATETANNGTTATYGVNAPGATVVAVFDGATKIDQVTGATGSITVPDGKTYVLQAVAGPIKTDGWGSTSISPVASIPTPTTTDTVAPVTTSDAAATYAGSAIIHLTAADNAGGSGVASTYFVLDGAAQVSGTAVLANTVGSHTVAFWSVDKAGNVEAQNTATFDVTAALPTRTPTSTLDPTATPVTTGTATARIHVMAAHGRGVAGATVTLTNTLTGTTVTGITDGHGRVTFSNLAKGTYTASVTLANGHVLTSTFRVGHDNRTITLKDHSHHVMKHVHHSAKHVVAKAMDKGQSNKGQSANRH